MAFSMMATLLLPLGLLSAGHLDHGGIVRLRNFLGYGHFALAYIFTWRLVRRQLGGRRAALGYVGVFLAVVALYAAAQRWWLAESIDGLFIMVIFMSHHFSNEVLFRQQTRNGYQPFPWTLRRILWVALAVWLVLVDRFATPDHPWHGAFAPLLAGWVAGWLCYGWRYLFGIAAPPSSRLGWAILGTAVLYWTTQPPREPFFAVQHKFAWIVIYHYVIWYVFYARKLSARTGAWMATRPLPRSPSEAWAFATTVPIGFLALVAIGNLVIFGIYLAVDPVAVWLVETTELDFFRINTFAHLIFGLGLPRTQPSVAMRRPSPGGLPQFA